MSRPYTVIHVSDLHIHCLPRRLGEWFSKRGVGALNLLLRRGWEHPYGRAVQMVRTLEALAWDHLIVTGDLTQLSLVSEFARVNETLAPLLARGPDAVTVLPGNHDRYVDDPAARAAYARYFGPYFGPGEIATKRLTERWWLAGWDSTRPTPVLDATGLVREETLAETDRWMLGLPRDARVIVANHYPVLTPPEHPSPHLHDLENREQVLAWLRAHPVDLYLHGHVHHNWVMPLEGGKRPTQIVNSASTTRIPRPTDRSAYHRIRLHADGRTEIEPMRLEKSH
jgi:3',5'-cyclic AMP phosphodiesterase CpdA